MLLGWLSAGRGGGLKASCVYSLARASVSLDGCLARIDSVDQFAGSFCVPTNSNQDRRYFGHANFHNPYSQHLLHQALPTSELRRHCHNEAKKAPGNTPEKQVLYKGRWMVPIYVAVRLKVFQLVGFGGLAVPLSALFANKVDYDLTLWLVSIAIVFGSVVASSALWFYSRRYIGELSLMGEQKNVIRFSVMDFWGKREDNDYPLEAMTPPLKGASKDTIFRLAEQPLIPIDVPGDRQYVISLRFGHLIDKELLFELMNGTYQEAKWKQLGMDPPSNWDSQYEM